jgi:phosphoribosylformylglycinamidine synthase
LISTIYLRRTEDDPEAQILIKRLYTEGFEQLQDLIIEKVFRLQGISSSNALSMAPLFCHSGTETLTTISTLDPKKGPVIEVGYQRAVTDPELPSIIRGSIALDIHNLSWVRKAHRYQFIGLDELTAKEIVTRYLYNPQVQIIIHRDESWESLKPQGMTGPVSTIPLNGLKNSELKNLSEERRLFLDLPKLRSLQKIAKSLNRHLTDAELEMFAQTWSDHCFHTTWKSLGLLQALWDATYEINHPLVLSVFEDNAGAMAFYDGWALTIKGETHNSPSAVSPYGGIMTKHGGVIRDTLGCGQSAWPIGGSTVMGLGDPRMSWSEVPKGSLHPKTILLESIRGTADYTNPMGIPMMFPVYRFHPGYTGKCFALGHSIGFIPENRCKKGLPISGDLAILIGGLTGMDGLHGATVSSSSMTSKTATVDAAHVQIGHPIEERKFMEVLPVLRDTDCLRAVTDLGAAGLSSAIGEMGSDTGILINLAWVPLKTEGMYPWEIWISESQERMLLCVPPEKCDHAMDILKIYEVQASIIGKFTSTFRCQVFFDDSGDLDPMNIQSVTELSGELVVDLDFNDLRKGCPIPKISVKKPVFPHDNSITHQLISKEALISAIRSTLSHLNTCDQSIAGYQFDSTVQGLTTVGPYTGEDNRMPSDLWVSTPIRGKPYGAAAAIGFNPFYGEIDPAGMAKLMMIEPITKLVAAGVDPGEIVLCDNFYTPQLTPEVAWMLKEMVDTCCKLSKEFKTPFISGKDSSSGTFIGSDGKRMDIPPTLCILALGRLPDVRHLITKPWKSAGNSIYLVGPLSLHLAGSIYLDNIGHRGNRLTNPDINQLKELWQSIGPLQKDGCIQSASAIAAGGLILRLFEMSLGSRLGCKILLSDLTEKLNTDCSEIGLFAEMIGSIIVEVEEKDTSRVKKDLTAVYLGRVIEESLISIDTGSFQLDLPMHELIQCWEKPFQEVAR